MPDPTNSLGLMPRLVNGTDLLREPTLEEMQRFGGVKRDLMSLDSYKREQRFAHLSEVAMYPVFYGGDSMQDPFTYGDFDRLVSAPMRGPSGINMAVDDATQYQWRYYYANSVMEQPRATDVCVLTADEEAAVEPDRGKLERYALEVESLSDNLTAQLAVEAEDCLGYSLLRRKLNMSGPLTRCLAALGIEPLCTKAVEQYKDEMVVFHRAEMKRNKTWNSVSRLAWVDHTLSDCSEYNIEVPEFVLSRCVQIARAMKDQNVAVEFNVEKLADVDPFMRVEAGDESHYIDVWDESKFEAQL